MLFTEFEGGKASGAGSTRNLTSPEANAGDNDNRHGSMGKDPLINTHLDISFTFDKLLSPLSTAANRCSVPGVHVRKSMSVQHSQSALTQAPLSTVKTREIANALSQVRKISL